METNIPPLLSLTTVLAQGHRAEENVFGQWTEILIRGLQGELDLPEFSRHVLHKSLCAFFKAEYVASTASPKESET